MSRDRRVLPHNLDAEASILGGILLRNDVLLQLETLEIDDFGKKGKVNKVIQAPGKYVAKDKKKGKK